jgi:hypothetical protein
MSKFTITTSKFRKVQGVPKEETLGSLEMIVTVKESNCVPSGMKVRSRVDPTMFTAEAPADMLSRLEDDPKVTSVAVSRPLRIIE